MFVIITLVFEFGFDRSDDSEMEEQIENESQIESEEQEEEKEFYKFNPPEP